MPTLEKQRGTPQNGASAGGEVVLTRAEADFLSLHAVYLDDDPFADLPDPELVDAARQAACLTKVQADFLRAWFEHKGDLISMSADLASSPGAVGRCLTSPAVLRILRKAAEVSPNLPPPVATKDELSAVWTRVSRDESLPLSYQREARQELAKLEGLYLNSGDAVNVGVQVVLKGDLTDG